MSRAFLTIVLFAAASCSSETPASAPEQPATALPVTDGPVTDDELSMIRNDRSRNAYAGGATTVFDITGEAFGHAAPNLGAASLVKHDVGDLGFEEVFAQGVLGPVFDNESCEACHFADGRGRPPRPG